MDELEQKLSQLMPRRPRGNEAELMYRCGWEAALASREELDRRAESDAHAVQIAAQLESQPKLWWKPFSSGALAGAVVVAAGLLVMQGIGMQPALRWNRPSDAVALTDKVNEGVKTSTGSPPNQGTANFDGRSSISPQAEGSLAGVNLPDLELARGTLDWLGGAVQQISVLSDSQQFAEPIIAKSDGGQIREVPFEHPLDALSVVARRRWGQALTQSSDVAADSPAKSSATTWTPSTRQNVLLELEGGLL